MNKAIFFSLIIMTITGIRLTYDREPVSSNKLSAITQHNSRAVSGNIESDYICGIFGDWVYRFPKALTGALIEYVGDNAWVGDIGRNKRGCADQFEGLIFLACLPRFTLHHFNYKGNEACIVRVRIFRSSGDRFIRWQVSSSRNSSLYPNRSDTYDATLGLYYFDTKRISVDRLFWRPANAGQPAIFGSCSIDAAYPQCRFQMFSNVLGAAISVGFEMTHIGRWEAFVHGAEDQLGKFKIRQVGGGDL
jgi:hypothetical protein